MLIDVTSSRLDCAPSGETPASVIDRPRVRQRLLDAAAYPIIHIVAPAGYGKTTALRQLLSHCDNPILISIPSSATNIDRFMHAFAQGCSMLFPTMASVPNEFQAEKDDSESRVAAYSRWAIAHLRGTKCTVAIDDLQHADADIAISTFLLALTEACRETVQWVFSSRTYGTLPKTRWLAYGLADTTITTDDLRMTHDEALDLAAALKCSLPREQITRWVDQTRGYPVPLTYAIRSSRRHVDAVSVTNGMESLTFNYLAEHLWSALSTQDRDLLELASFVPAAHITNYANCGVASAEHRISNLCDDIIFLTLTANGIFSMHDLFRDFIKQQIALRSKSIRYEITKLAYAVLLNADRYNDALEILTETGDATELAKEIDRLPIDFGNLPITPKLIAITESIALEEMPVGVLSLHAGYWSRYNAASKALRFANALINRSDAHSSQILCAIRAISRFMHYRSVDGYRTWSSKLPALLERMGAHEQALATAYQANCLARLSELRTEAAHLAQTALEAVKFFAPNERLDILIVSASTLFCLDDLESATVLSKEAITISESLAEPNQMASAWNTLGIILYTSASAEYEKVSNKTRTLVERSGAWRFSQSSHWLPVIYYARCGNATQALDAARLHDDVLLGDENQKRWLANFKRVGKDMCSMITEDYASIQLNFSKHGFPEAIDTGYHVAVILALSHAFQGDDAAASIHLAHANKLRSCVSTPWDRQRIGEMFGGEIIALCLIGKWTQARRLIRHLNTSDASISLKAALHLLCEGQPFLGLAGTLEECLEQPYVGFLAMLMKRALTNLSAKSAPILTAAESEILRFIGLGKSNKDIALSRARSAETVKRQVASLFRKLGVENRTSAVAIARERGLL